MSYPEIVVPLRVRPLNAESEKTPVVPLAPTPVKVEPTSLTSQSSMTMALSSSVIVFELEEMPIASQSAYVTPTAEGAVRPTDNPMVLPETSASDDVVEPVEDSVTSIVAPPSPYESFTYNL